MYIFFKKTSGDIAFTLNGKGYPPHLVNDEIGVIESDFIADDLSCWKVIEGELVKVTIQPVKDTFLEKVRTEMAKARSVFVTNLPGQDMIYLRKEREALAFVAEVSPNISDYPMIAAEIGITAPTAFEVVQVWLNMSNLWRLVACQLETIRLTAGNDIQSADTVEEVEMAFSAFEAQIAALLSPNLF